ncbi:hypothetical protein F5X99DRAFT_150074 [Biscogniauxia marginata]|nr:hypothetical protein F5X99DRAFT_150074 [Biscogniauxia marginata]
MKDYEVDGPYEADVRGRCTRPPTSIKKYHEAWDKNYDHEVVMYCPWFRVGIRLREREGGRKTEWEKSLLWAVWEGSVAVLHWEKKVNVVRLKKFHRQTQSRATVCLETKMVASTTTGIGIIRPWGGWLGGATGARGHRTFFSAGGGKYASPPPSSKDNHGNEHYMIATTLSFMSCFGFASPPGDGRLADFKACACMSYRRTYQHQPPFVYAASYKNFSGHKFMMANESGFSIYLPTQGFF